MRPSAHLTREEEQALARRFRDHGDLAARDRLVMAHLPLGRALARRAKAGGLQREDLEQQAVLGLIRSAETFDPGRGVRFNTLARWWVRTFLDDYIVRNAQVVRPSLSGGRGSRIAGIRIVSLDQPVGGEEGSTLGDVIPDERPLPDEIVAQIIDAEAGASRVAVALAKLSARSRAVVEGRFVEGAKLRTIGDRLGVSSERVRQIEAAALKRLRQLMRRRADHGN
jgi:RNA polymerase sigma-32 factor